MPNRIEIYHKTIDILFKAYFNDELDALDCAACAVGNIISKNNGFIMLRGGFTYKWFDEKFRQVLPAWGKYNHTGDEHERERQEKSTGYTSEELYRIERAFIKECDQQSPDEDNFNGLCSVIECLKEIHEIDDTSTDINRLSVLRQIKSTSKWPTDANNKRIP